MKFTPITLALLCACFSACSSITRVKSKPPYSSITVNRPFSWSDGAFGTRADMPAGTYTPRYEDKEGYYYQAPEKITGRDGWVPLLLDGGLYFERDLSSPEKIYLTRGDAKPAKASLRERPDLTLNP